MEILKIRKYPDSILRKKCDQVKEITPEIRELVLNMMETMVKEQGIGLAASQVGELKRIIIVQTEKGPEAFINPEIVKKSSRIEAGEEGCLSFSGLFLKIKRAKEVEIEALNLEGEKITVKAENLLARVFQHEIDHLDGVLLIDRVGAGQRLWQLIKNSLFPRK